MKGTVNPNGSPTSVVLQVNARPSDCSSIQTFPLSGVLTGTADIQVSLTASSRVPGIRYAYRLVATNAAGVTYTPIKYTSPWILSAAEPEESPSAVRPALALVEVTATPAWQVFLPTMRRCPTDGF